MNSISTRSYFIDYMIKPSLFAVSHGFNNRNKTVLPVPQKSKKSIKIKKNGNLRPIISTSTSAPSSSAGEQLHPAALLLNQEGGTHSLLDWGHQHRLPRGQSAPAHAPLHAPAAASSAHRPPEHARTEEAARREARPQGQREARVSRQEPAGEAPRGPRY